MRKLALGILVFFALLTSTLSAQVVSFNTTRLSEDFKQNVKVYSEQYLDPALTGFGYNLSNGWQFHTGTVLNPFRFRFGLYTSGVIIPEGATRFNFYQQPFTDRIRMVDPSEPNLPTAFGGATDKKLIYRVEGDLEPGGVPVSYEQELDALPGIRLPLDLFPNVMPQLAMGLPANFQITVRGTPRVNLDGVDFSQFGVGAHNEISKWFLEDSNFHLLFGATYSMSRFRYDFSGFIQGEDQEVEFIGHSILSELTISYKLKAIEFFGRAGFYSNTANFNINGTYRYETDESTPVGGSPLINQTVFEVKDPVQLSKYELGVVGSLGARLALGNVFSIGTGVHVSKFTSIDASLLFEFGKSE